MSSLASVIVFAIFTTLTLALIGYCLNSLATQISILTYYAEYIERSLSKELVELMVKDIRVSQDNITLHASLLNKCCRPIAVRDLNKLDIILVYRTSDNETRVVWLPYDLSKSIDEGWRPIEIKHYNQTELINLTSSDFTSGLWDVNEYVTIEAWVRDDREIYGEPHLIISPPEGGWRYS
ncbi:MAG: hypothetical protein N3G77_00900 [Nitrososphaeria archaeon]|nr:hypothetical protein [Nitrososphaeria archaeon]